MKLYDGGRAPNPRRVRIFLAEKGISLPLEQIDLNSLEHKKPNFTAINPFQRIPALELDDGTVIGESVAICRYFEELQPEPALFGMGALGRATVEMWNRRLELSLMMPVAFAFRHLHPGAATIEVPQVAQWGEINKGRALEFLPLLERHLADNEYIAGKEFSIADITGGIAIDFMKPAKLLVPETCPHIRRWHALLVSRPGWLA